MRDYAKFSPFFWTRGSGKQLRGQIDAQVVAIYLSTSPTANMIGLYYVSLVTVGHETGLGEKRAKAAVRLVEQAGFASYDFEAELVWVRNHAKFEIGSDLKPGDKRRGKVLAELAQVGDHPFAVAFVERYGQAYGLTATSMPHRRGIEGASESEGSPIEGASAILGQDRTGSDQDQDRSGSGQIRIVGTAAVASEPDTPSSGVKAKSARASDDRGTRLPGDWTPSEETQVWARKHGYPPLESLEEFRNYWASTPGFRGRKCNWDLVYRNRLERLYAGSGTRLVAARGGGGSRIVQPATNRQWELPEGAA